MLINDTVKRLAERGISKEEIIDAAKQLGILRKSLKGNLFINDYYFANLVQHLEQKGQESRVSSNASRPRKSPLQAPSQEFPIPPRKVPIEEIARIAEIKNLPLKTISDVAESTGLLRTSKRGNPYVYAFQVPTLLRHLESSECEKSGKRNSLSNNESEPTLGLNEPDDEEDFTLADLDWDLDPDGKESSRPRDSDSNEESTADSEDTPSVPHTVQTVASLDHQPPQATPISDSEKLNKFKPESREAPPATDATPPESSPAHTPNRNAMEPTDPADLISWDQLTRNRHSFSANAGIGVIGLPKAGKTALLRALPESLKKAGTWNLLQLSESWRFIREKQLSKTQEDTFIEFDGKLLREKPGNLFHLRTLETSGEIWQDAFKSDAYVSERVDRGLWPVVSKVRRFVASGRAFLFLIDAAATRGIEGSAYTQSPNAKLTVSEALGTAYRDEVSRLWNAFITRLAELDSKDGNEVQRPIAIVLTKADIPIRFFRDPQDGGQLFERDQFAIEELAEVERIDDYLSIRKDSTRLEERRLRAADFLEKEYPKIAQDLSGHGIRISNHGVFAVCCLSDEEVLSQGLHSAGVEEPLEWAADALSSRLAGERRRRRWRKAIKYSMTFLASILIATYGTLWYSKKLEQDREKAALDEAINSVERIRNAVAMGHDSTAEGEIAAALTSEQLQEVLTANPELRERFDAIVAERWQTIINREQDRLDAAISQGNTNQTERLLQDLQSTMPPARAADLSPSLSHSLKDYEKGLRRLVLIEKIDHTIEQISRAIKQGDSGQAERRIIAHLESDHFTVDLTDHSDIAPEIDRLIVARWRLKLSEMEREIRRAVSAEAFDKAWAILNDYSSVRASTEAALSQPLSSISVAQLRSDLYVKSIAAVNEFIALRRFDQAWATLAAIPPQVADSAATTNELAVTVLKTLRNSVSFALYEIDGEAAYRALKQAETIYRSLGKDPQVLYETTAVIWTMVVERISASDPDAAADLWRVRSAETRRYQSEKQERLIHNAIELGSAFKNLRHGNLDQSLAEVDALKNRVFSTQFIEQLIEKLQYVRRYWSDTKRNAAADAFEERIRELSTESIFQHTVREDLAN